MVGFGGLGLLQLEGNAHFPLGESVLHCLSLAFLELFFVAWCAACCAAICVAHVRSNSEDSREIHCIVALVCIQRVFFSRLWRGAHVEVPEVNQRFSSPRRFVALRLLRLYVSALLPRRPYGFAAGVPTRYCKHIATTR
jgi:hypothetical protein